MIMQLLKMFLLMTAISEAALGADAHHGGGIPAMSIFWQAFNLTIALLIIYFATRKSMKEYFLQRQTSFVATAQKSEAAKAEAERQLKDIHDRLKQLSQTYGESIARAQAEAADLKKQMIVEAQDLAKRIKDEAHMTVKIEAQRAQRALHEKFVSDSVGSARTLLAKDIGTADHQRLQTDFTKNIEVVSP